MTTFIASRISGNNNLLFPDRIDIESDRVTFYKGSLIGYQSCVIPFNQIASVRLITGIFFADLIIETTGGRYLEVNGLFNSDAEQAESLLY